MHYFIIILLVIICRYYYKQNTNPKSQTANLLPPKTKNSDINDLSNQDKVIINNLLNNKRVKKRGKTEFTKQEIIKIERLLADLRFSALNQQKAIRKQLRSLGFYISNYGAGITLEKLHIMIAIGEIKVINQNSAKSLTKNTLQREQAKTEQKEFLCKSFKPIVFKDSHILILGTMPGAESLKNGEYYASSSNSFWKIIESIYNNGHKFTNYEEKIACLKKNHISLWDVYEVCERDGSLDSSINNAKLNDIDSFLSKHKSIKRIIFNGQKASLSYQPKIEYSVLCSTSNSNSHFSFNDKVKEWKRTLKKQP